MNNLDNFFIKTADRIKGDRFLSNSFIFFVGSFLVGLGSYLFQFLMARMLRIEAYGELQSLVSIFMIVGVLAASLSTVLAKYTAAFRTKEKWGSINNLFSFFAGKILIITIIFSIIFIAFSSYVANFLKLTSALPVIILGVSFVIIFLTAINMGIIQGLEQFKELSIIGIIQVCFKIFLGVFLVKLGFDVNGAVGAIVLAGLIGYLVSFLPIKFLFKKAKEEIETRGIFQYSFPVLLVFLSITLLYNVDIILVKHLFPPETAGEYGVLSVLGRIIFFLAGPIIGVMFPMAAAAWSNKSEPAKILKKAVFLVSFIGLPVLFLYFLFPNFIIKVLIGGKFLAISQFLGWFGLAMFLLTLVNLFAQYFLSIQKTKCAYLVVAVVLLQIILISLFHNNLWQIVWIMNGVMLAALASLLIYYFKTKEGKIYA